MNNKLKTITNLFEENEISCRCDCTLIESSDARKYWSVLKLRLKKEGSELTTKYSQLKLQRNNFLNYEYIENKKEIE